MEDRAEMLVYHYLAALELTRAAGGDTAPLEAPARRALRDAGRRAYSLSALEAAIGFFGQALELWPSDDPDYPLVLFELGSALFWARNEGGAELQQAADRLLAAGDVEDAAEAESRLAYFFWVSGAQQEARTHSERSVELIALLPETRTTAAIRAYTWRIQLLQGEHPSLEEGQRILALTEELGTTEDILNGRITLAIGRAMLTGDVATTMRELASALEDALRANSHLAARAYINLATFTAAAGELGRAAELMRAGVEVARRFQSHHERWLEAGLIQDYYYAGAWERAIEEAEAFIQDPGSAAYMESPMLGILALTAAARGDRAGADARAAALIARAREIGDPQALQPALGQCARLALEAGDEARARAFVDEFAQSLSADAAFVGPDTIHGCVAAEALGQGAGLREVLGNAPRNPWVEAGSFVAEGRLEEAGDLLYAHEDFAHAALVGLLAAERAGRETSGLREAVSFYERVGAIAYLVRAERLLQASA